MFRRRRSQQPPPPNAYVLPEPWRSLIVDAQRAEQAFSATVGGMRPGPLRDRLALVWSQVDAAVRECWVIAEHGAQLVEAVGRLNPAEIHRRIALVEAELARVAPNDPSLAYLRQTAESMQNQEATVQRLAAVANGTKSRLQLLCAQLGEAVAQAVEVSVQQEGSADVGALSGQVDALIDQLQSLRRAVTDVNQPSLGAGAAGAALPPGPVPHASAKPPE